MSDVVSSLSSGLATAQTAPARQTRSSYSATREVQNIAAHARRSSSAEEQAAMVLLDRALKSGTQPPANLPRGHLLNIVV